MACVGPRSLPEVALTPPDMAAVPAPPGLSPPMVAHSWESLVDAPAIETAPMLFSCGVIMGVQSEDLTRYEIWQLHATTERRALNEIEALYQLPHRDLPKRVFEFSRTQ